MAAVPRSSSGSGADLSWAALEPDMGQLPLKGGMGTVFKARWTRRHVDVAVKLLHAYNLAPADLAKAAADLEREAGLLRIASEAGANAFVVPQYGVARGAPTDAWRAHLGISLGLFVCSDISGASVGGAAGGAGVAVVEPSGELLGIVMAWLPGGTLAGRLHGRVRWVAHTAERLRLLEDVARGVAMLHNAEPELVVHGDIKSDNVLLTEHGAAQLGDFGRASVRRAFDDAATRSTRSEQAGGTLAYMAPEMFKLNGVEALTASPSTDVFALSTLCWEVLVGERPWKSDSDRWVALCGGKSLDFTRLPKDVPNKLCVLLERGVSVDRKLRPNSDALADGLREAREQLESGRFDVFISHRWENKAHAPVTVAVLQALRTQNLRVWVDESEMRHDMVASMTGGVAKSTAFVALVSKRYAESPNCMLELREALRLGRRVVSCFVEPDHVAWVPSADAGSENERELANAVNMKVLKFADLREACSAGKAGGWDERRWIEELLKSTEMQALLDLVIERVRADAALQPSAAPQTAGAVERVVGPVLAAPPTASPPPPLVVEDAALRSAALQADAALILAQTAGTGAELPAAGMRLPSTDANAAAQPRTEAARRTLGTLLLAQCTAARSAAVAEDRAKAAAEALRLIERGADPSATDANGDSALIAASTVEALDEVAARLIAAGAALDAVGRRGATATALYWACAFRREATACALVQAGADVNVVARHDGKTALEHAVQNKLAAAEAAIRARGGRTAAELGAAARA